MAKQKNLRKKLGESEESKRTQLGKETGTPRCSPPLPPPTWRYDNSQHGREINQQCWMGRKWRDTGLEPERSLPASKLSKEKKYPWSQMIPTLERPWLGGYRQRRCWMARWEQAWFHNNRRMLSRTENLVKVGCTGELLNLQLNF